LYRQNFVVGGVLIRFLSWVHSLEEDALDTAPYEHMKSCQWVLKSRGEVFYMEKFWWWSILYGKGFDL